MGIVEAMIELTLHDEMCMWLCVGDMCCKRLIELPLVVTGFNMLIELS